eukprot:scaffold97613_cov30-Tisochrysis_lutea.AAC.3
MCGDVGVGRSPLHVDCTSGADFRRVLVSSTQCAEIAPPPLRAQPLFLFVLQVSALSLRLVDDLTDDPTDIVPNTDGTALVLDGIDPDFCFVLFNGAEQLLEISLPKAATSRPLFHFGFGFGVTIAANALYQ